MSNLPRGDEMKTKAINLIMQPPTVHSYWAEIITQSICQEASRREVPVLQYDTPDALLRQGPTACGALLVGHSNQWFMASAALLSKSGIQPTLASAYIAVDERYNAVFFSLPTAVREALGYLKHAGRPRVALIGINPDSPADCAKAQAFESAARELSLEGCVNIPGGDRTISDCADLLLEGLEQFDSALCANDSVAFCVMERMLREGLKVPDDLFLIGMGNSRFGRIYHTPVTSIAFDYQTLGRQAVQLYLMASGDDAGIRWRMSLPCKLLPRATTAFMQQRAAAPVRPDGPDPEAISAYYADPDVRFFNRVEGILQHCDEWDYRILKGLMAGETYLQIAQAVHFSERTIKYRIKKLISRAGTENRAELCALLAPIWCRPAGGDAMPGG